MMKKILLLGLIVFSTISCENIEEESDCNQYDVAYSSIYVDPKIYSEYEPIEISIDDLGSLITFKEPFPVIESGKIYIKDDLLIIGEKGLGFHVFDNSDPKNPIQKKFLNVESTSDISIRGDYVYINQYKDLVTLKVDFTNFTFEETGREKEVFTFYNNYGKLSPDGYYFYPEQDMVITGFTKKENFVKPAYPDHSYMQTDCYNYSDVLAGARSLESSLSDGQAGSLARFILKGDYLYTVDNRKLNTFFIGETHIGNPNFVSSKDVGFSIETLFANNNHLFIGSQLGMYIYNIDIPSNPVYTSEARHFRACDPVISNDKYAFVTIHGGAACGGDMNALLIYDIETDITNPTLLLEQGLISPKGLTLYKNYLLVADNAIRVIDVSNLEQKEIKILSKVSVDVNDFILRGDHLFAIGKHAVYQYSLSEKENSLDFELLSQVDF